jgi:RNA polymerase sigma-70 factor, ECF subfamily
MVAVRIDDRLAARIDASDVVQETLMLASKQLADYLRDPPLPFYPWLRQIAWNRLTVLHRRHLETGKRNVSRDQPLDIFSASAIQLAERSINDCVVQGNRKRCQGKFRSRLNQRMSSWRSRCRSSDSTM